MNYTFITGASNGIGYVLVMLFAKNGHNLILVARQGNKLIQLADDLKKNYLIKILIISFDFSCTDAAEEILGQIHEKPIHVNYLVNNAGFYVKIAEEVSGSGVNITALCPGGTNTAFQDLSKRGKFIFFPTMEASGFAKTGYKALMKCKRAIIPGMGYKIQVFLIRFIPRNLVSKLTESMVNK